MARHFLKEALLPEGVKVVRLTFTPHPYFQPEFVEKIIDELSIKEMMVRTGMDEFSAVDKLAFRLLYESGVMAGTLPELKKEVT
jgi:hypothetical protein